MEVSGNSQRDGGIVQLGIYTGALNQQWIIDQPTGKFVCVGSNLCLDIGKDPRRGPNMIQWKRKRGRNQIFDYNPDTMKIQSGDNRFLDINGPISSGTPLFAIDETPRGSQQWVIRSTANPAIRYVPTPNPAITFDPPTASPVTHRVSPPVPVPSGLSRDDLGINCPLSGRGTQAVNSPNNWPFKY
jgi:hypothetical protein